METVRLIVRLELMTLVLRSRTNVSVSRWVSDSESHCR